MAAAFDLTSEAKKLIRFNTVTWSSNADCAVHVGALMRKVGLQVSYQEGRAGETLFMNVAGFAGGGKQPLLLATHLDTVSPGDPKLWTKTGGDPWRLTARGDSWYGLGTADTKLDFLCKLLAFSRVDPSRLKRPVILLGTFGEESGLRGAARFCQGELPKPAMALVGEPTELALVPRHKGLAVLEITLRSRGLFRPSSGQWAYAATLEGQASHSSTPHLGRNALLLSVEFLRQLQKKFPKLEVLSWEGGEAHNILPASARLRFALPDRPKTAFPSGKGRKVQAQRIPPGWYSTLPWEKMLRCLETLADVLRPLEKPRDREFDPPHLTWNVTQLKEGKEGWALAADVRPLPGQSLTTTVRSLEGKLWKQFGPPGPVWQFRLERDNPALDLDGKEPVLRLARAALRAARVPLRVRAKSGCSEAGLYRRVGIPSLVVGPGRSAGNIHRPNECICVRQLKAAIRFYEGFIRKACL